jgi:hypothetical protein
MLVMSSERHSPVIVVGYDGSEACRAGLTLDPRRAGRPGQVFVVHVYGLPRTRDRPASHSCA